MRIMQVQPKTPSFGNLYYLQTHDEYTNKLFLEDAFPDIAEKHSDSFALHYFAPTNHDVDTLVATGEKDVAKLAELKEIYKHSVDAFDSYIKGLIKSAEKIDIPAFSDLKQVLPENLSTLLKIAGKRFN